MNDLKQQRAKLEGLVDSQIDPTSGLAINCRNCIHCDRDRFGPNFDKCLKTGGQYCEIVLKYPSFYGHFCRNYSSWSPRKGIDLSNLPFSLQALLFGFSFIILSYIFGCLPFA